MNSTPLTDAAEAHARLARFITGETSERLFSCPTGHPSEPTGFCWCEGSFWQALRVYTRGALLQLVLLAPLNGLKVWWLRRLGAKVGRNVYLSVGVWIDPLFPRLLEIEDNVFIGMNARILMHEFRADAFRAGKVILRRRAFIGGFSIIACGVEVGEGAEVAGGAVVPLDVPPHTLASGNPAFFTKRSRPPTAEAPHE
jgi:acetyltransferase-like isoleucine patch superfamily enzyme